MAIGNPGLKGTGKSAQIEGAGPDFLGLNPVSGTDLDKLLSVSEMGLWTQFGQAPEPREGIHEGTHTACSESPAHLQAKCWLDETRIVPLPGVHCQLSGL